MSLPHLSATIATASSQPLPPSTLHSAAPTSRSPTWSCHAAIPEDSCLLPLTDATAHRELNPNVSLLPTCDCWCADKWGFTALEQHNKSTVQAKLEVKICHLLHQIHHTIAWRRLKPPRDGLWLAPVSCSVV